MAVLVLFHHAQGLTPGCLVFADAGHVVHVPDLYDGSTFTELADGMASVEATGFDTAVERGRTFAEGLPDEVVYARFSLG